MKHLLILITTLFSFTVTAQDKLIFNISLGKMGVDYLVSRGLSEARDFEAITNFLSEDLNGTVVYTDEQRNLIFKKTESICKIIDVAWEIGSFKRDFGAVGRYPIKIIFQYCDGQRLTYDFFANINGNTRDLKMPILRGLKKTIPPNDIYEKLYKSKVGTNIKVIPEEKLENIITNLQNEVNSLVGIYKLISSPNFTSIEKIGIFYVDGKINIINLENNSFQKDWKIGQIIGTLDSTASTKYFTGNYRGLDDTDSNIAVMFQDNIIELSFTENKEIRKFIKIK